MSDCFEQKVTNATGTGKVENTQSVPCLGTENSSNVLTKFERLRLFEQRMKGDDVKTGLNGDISVDVPAQDGTLFTLRRSNDGEYSALKYLRADKRETIATVIFDKDLSPKGGVVSELSASYNLVGPSSRVLVPVRELEEALGAVHKAATQAAVK